MVLTGWEGEGEKRLDNKKFVILFFKCNDFYQKYNFVDGFITKNWKWKSGIQYLMFWKNSWKQQPSYHAKTMEMKIHKADCQVIIVKHFREISKT